MNTVKDKKISIIITVILVIFSIYIFLTASNFPKEAGMFPKIVSVITFILLVGQLVTEVINVYRVSKNEDSTKERQKKPANKNFWITISSLIIYPALIFIIGYFPATALYLGITMYLYGYNKVPRVILITGVMVVFIYLGFVLLLRIKLPVGLLLGGI